jgi:hypothetical protein
MDQPVAQHPLGEPLAFRPERAAQAPRRDLHQAAGSD